MNIAGVIVFSNPKNRLDLQERLIELPGVEIHAVNDDGKMVVTIENEREADLADTVMQMQNIRGVLSASMVYHHNENNINEQETSQ